MLLLAIAPRSLPAPAGPWWTGKDSNLRSPQGAADLQSAGFNHSPTRPRKFVWIGVPALRIPEAFRAGVHTTATAAFRP